MDPMLILYYGIVALALIAGMALHEASHALAAAKLGDDTASQKGRVSLNPLKHIDPFGTVLLPAMLFFTHAPFLFGYAKPVPVSWSKLRKPKRDMSIVAAAGPAANFVLAIILFALSALVSLTLDGEAHAAIGAGLELGAFANVAMGVFNLIPVPPLDGSKVLAGLLPDKLAMPYLRLGRYGFLPVLLLLVVLTVIRHLP